MVETGYLEENMKISEIKDPWLDGVSDDAIAMLEEEHTKEVGTGFYWLNKEPLVNPEVSNTDNRYFFSNGFKAKRGKVPTDPYIVDFIPFGKAEPVYEAKSIILYKAYLGLKDFIKYADKFDLKDDVVLEGSTNSVMANLAVNFGFDKIEDKKQSEDMDDIEEMLQDYFNGDLNEDEVEVVTTVGKLRKHFRELEENRPSLMEKIKNRAEKEYDRLSQTQIPTPEEYLKLAKDVSQIILKRKVALQCLPVVDTQNKDNLTLVVTIPNHDFEWYGNNYIEALNYSDSIYPFSYLEKRDNGDWRRILLSSLNAEMYMKMEYFLSSLPSNDAPSSHVGLKINILPENFNEHTAMLAAVTQQDPDRLLEIIDNSDIQYSAEEIDLLKETIDKVKKARNKK